MNEHVELLVIGGGPAGLAAAQSYREHGGDGPVLIVSTDPALPYARPPLSKAFLRGDSSEDELPLQSPGFYRDLRIDTRLACEVTALRPRDGVAALGDGRQVHYRSCVLATGATPAALPVPGADDPRVHRLRSLASARALIEQAGPAGTAAVLGSGFIGCEAAASLARRGLGVTLITDEPLPQHQRLGADAGRRIAAWLAEEGVTVLTDRPVARIDNAQTVHTDGHPPVAADLVLMAGGITPNGQLAEAAGLTMTQGRVEVDAHLQSSSPNVFAAGDVALAHNATAGRALPVEHWGEALTMGAIAGAGAAGADETWRNAPGFWSTIGDRTIKYVAWGDGHEQSRLIEHGPDAFTIWYGQDGIIVGVLTYHADEDYEQGRTLVEQRAAFS